MDAISASASYDRQSFLLQASFQYESQNASVQTTSGPNGRQDIVQLGSQSMSIELSLEIVVERAQGRVASRMAPHVPENAPAWGLRRQMDDFSPEAVSQRIVDFATGFLGAYLENHGDEPADAATTAFADLIRGAIEEGFDQARDILGAMSALSPEIADSIQQTFDLTMQRLDEFFAQLRGDAPGDVVDLANIPEGTMIEAQQERISLSISLSYTRETQSVSVTQQVGSEVNATA